MRCACCREPLGHCTGESSIYSPIPYELCEECFLEEDEAITERGSNNWPERLEQYERHQPGGRDGV